MKVGPLRVVINAQLRPGGYAGGVEQFVMSLVLTLGRLDDSRERYMIVGHPKDSHWLQPYLGRNQTIVVPPSEQVDRLERMKRLLGPWRAPIARLVRKARQGIFGARGAVPPVATSDGFFESLGDVVHFPFQSFVKSRIPSIYNPHDLQHLHYPDFFRAEDIDRRERIYRVGCAESTVVATESVWVKRDITRQYRVDAAKICVIPMAPPTQLFPVPDADDLRVVAHKFQLPESFALFPAQTWAHKNHVRLLEAVALLRERDGRVVKLICTGRQNQFWPTIENQIGTLQLGDQVRFIGFVTPGELRALYRTARFVVIPSLFEGGGFPVLEALLEGTPIACSNATSLPEYAGDAALLFDPTSAESIAAALRQMTSDDRLLTSLSQRASNRIRMFTWERTAKAYRAFYRALGGARLTEEDRELLRTANDSCEPFGAAQGTVPERTVASNG